jgi:hypothetical protein
MSCGDFNLPDEMPRYVDRRDGASIIRKLFGPCSPRTLEAWPLPWRRFNGKAVTSTAGLIAEAQRRFDEAPAIRGGRAPTRCTTDDAPKAAIKAGLRGLGSNKEPRQ